VAFSTVFPDSNYDVTVMFIRTGITIAPPNYSFESLTSSGFKLVLHQNDVLDNGFTVKWKAIRHD
jgi:hypothetical protein